MAGTLDALLEGMASRPSRDTSGQPIQLLPPAFMNDAIPQAPPLPVSGMKQHTQATPPQVAPIPTRKPIPEFAGQETGLAANNPGNIEANPANDWVGKVPSEGRFEKFIKPEYGIRALGKLLPNLERKYKTQSLGDLINLYAPNHENPTDKYVEFLAKKYKIPMNKKLDLKKNKKLLRELMKGIIHFENGVQPYSNDFIEKAMKL